MFGLNGEQWMVSACGQVIRIYTQNISIVLCLSYQCNEHQVYCSQFCDKIRIIKLLAVFLNGRPGVYVLQYCWNKTQNKQEKINPCQ